ISGVIAAPAGVADAILKNEFVSIQYVTFLINFMISIFYQLNLFVYFKALISESEFKILLLFLSTLAVDKSVDKNVFYSNNPRK
mgnify:CR=1